MATMRPQERGDADLIKSDGKYKNISDHFSKSVEKMNWQQKKSIVLINCVIYLTIFPVHQLNAKSFEIIPDSVRKSKVFIQPCFLSHFDHDTDNTGKHFAGLILFFLQTKNLFNKPDK